MEILWREKGCQNGSVIVTWVPIPRPTWLPKVVLGARRFLILREEDIFLWVDASLVYIVNYKPSRATY